MAAEIHVGDSGTAFVATMTDNGVILDIGSAITRELLFQRPDGTVVTKPAQLTTDGSDGQMEYVSETGFLDQEGIWRWQPYLAFGVGTWHGEMRVFAVRPNLV